MAGSALATVISQYFAGLGLTIYAWEHFPRLRFKKSSYGLRPSYQ
ncbi:hypothetical protein [Lactobacillus delbrueckii]